MLTRLWHGSAPLTIAGLLMLAALAASLAGIVWDPRAITGMPAWLKPAKFAVSIALYSFTLAWIFTCLPAWPRMRRLVGWVSAVALTVELVIIDLQAWRGTTSHFNIGTPFDGVLWVVMGVTIVIQTVTSVAVAVALWRTPFTDRALGWALRFGMAITIVGAFSGGLMARATPAQREAARPGQAMIVAGAHTVGAPDGGPGFPVTGWSRSHGDMRVAHFAGLHAIQLLPIVALLLRRKRLPDEARTRLTLTAATSYAAFVALVLWQALRGQSLIDPDALTLGALAAWIVLTAAAVRWSLASRRRTSAPTAHTPITVARQTR